VFPCTQYLKGRLYPSPGTPCTFILDFINNHGARVLDDTGLTIYGVGWGLGARKAIGSSAAYITSVWSPEQHGKISFFMLSTSWVVEVVDQRNQVLKRISFYHPEIMTAVPVLG
jgi:hypothetical protein